MPHIISVRFTFFAISAILSMRVGPATAHVSRLIAGPFYVPREAATQRGSGCLLGKLDDLDGHAALGVRGDLQLHLHGAQNFARLRCDGVTLPRLHRVRLDRLKCLPKRLFEIDG